MSKRERTVMEFNITAVKAAATNASKLHEVALEVPSVDPKDLSIDEQIFGIELQPINKDLPVTPDTTKYLAVKPILVDTLSGRAKPGFITVNGTIDIPKEAGRVTKVEDCYFTDQAQAKAVCRVITEVEFERSINKQELEKLNSDFLAKQLQDDRF